MAHSLGFSNHDHQNARGHPWLNISRENEPPTKRRKIRKGTHSCWECKRRKERCIYLHKDKICVSCQKRSTACVSQEFANDSPSREPQSTSQLQRVETLLQQVLDRLDGGGSGGYQKSREDSLNEYLDGSERDFSLLETQREGSDGVQFNQSPNVNVQPGLECQHCPGSQPTDISQMLYAALPTRRDAEIICRATIRHQMGDIMVCAYDSHDSDSHALARELLDYPSPTASPALIARHLLRFATHLQKCFRPELHEEIKELSAPLPTLIASYADAAAQIVSQDRLLGNVDSLECMVLLGIFECSRGNMRLSWMLVRRTIAVAQMNGLHLNESRQYHPAPDIKSKLPGPHRFWIRLNFYDRLASLLLALPMSVQDNSISADTIVADESPLSRLERMHCVILGEIVKRNQADPTARCLETTRALDLQLQRVTEILPATWWTMPVLSSKTGFRNDMKRITLQVLHSHLILQLHLPHLLQSSPGSEYELSRIACVDSARGILTRFILCRNLRHDDMVCRVSDFIAFIAAVTLVLAYLSRHHQCLKTSTLSLHHRHADLGMIQQVEELMREDNPVGFDSQCIYMADMLHQLSRMEAKAADGCKIAIKHIKSSGVPSGQDQTTGAATLHVPYFGTIVINPETGSCPDGPGRYSESVCGQNPGSELSINSMLESTAKALGPSNLMSFSSTDPALLTPAESLVSFDAMPSMFAGPDDWTLQGIDTTLFSSLFGQVGGDWVLNA